MGLAGRGRWVNSKFLRQISATTSSQAAASAACGQTWEMRIPVCSAIESAEVNLALKVVFQVDLVQHKQSDMVRWKSGVGKNLTRSPAAAALHSSQEGAKPAEARARVAAMNRT